MLANRAVGGVSELRERSATSQEQAGSWHYVKTMISILTHCDMKFQCHSQPHKLYWMCLYTSCMYMYTRLTTTYVSYMHMYMYTRQYKSHVETDIHVSFHRVFRSHHLFVTD